MANRLVALDLPAGPEFVDALRRTWDAGDAAFPVDQRLPDAARAHLLAALAPSVVVGPDGATAELAGGRPTEPGDALVVATSGTTGAPRGVVLTHAAVAASAAATCTRLGATAGVHWIACLPLSHVGGLSVVTRALHLGASLTVLPGFDAEAIATAVASHPRDSLVSLVPTTLRRIDTGLFRTIVLGGARPPADLPANVVTTYGMTETGSGVVYDGRPLDEVEYRIVDGEVHLRGPMLLRAYRDGTDPKVDGWLATGDLGHLAPDGRLEVEGRRGDLIITGGENVWPDTVEAALITHPDVSDVAVAGTPDAEWGQVVTAFVVTSSRSLDVHDLRQHGRGELASFALPRRVVRVSEIPRTALGKIARSSLRADD
ncbi:o-succinylbenzoate--CoA ligase [soil metagenome]